MLTVKGESLKCDVKMKSLHFAQALVSLTDERMFELKIRILHRSIEEVISSVMFEFDVLK